MCGWRITKEVVVVDVQGVEAAQRRGRRSWNPHRRGGGEASKGESEERTRDGNRWEGGAVVMLLIAGWAVRGAAILEPEERGSGRSKGRIW